MRRNIPKEADLTNTIAKYISLTSPSDNDYHFSFTSSGILIGLYKNGGLCEGHV